MVDESIVFETPDEVVVVGEDNATGPEPGADVTGFAEGDACVCTAEAGETGLRGVGKRIGVTATTIAVSNRAIESLLSIYGTGSNPPGRKG